MLSSIIDLALRCWSILELAAFNFHVTLSFSLLGLLIVWLPFAWLWSTASLGNFDDFFLIRSSCSSVLQVAYCRRYDLLLAVDLLL